MPDLSCPICAKTFVDVDAGCPYVKFADENYTEVLRIIPVYYYHKGFSIKCTRTPGRLNSGIPKIIEDDPFICIDRKIVSTERKV